MIDCNLSQRTHRVPICSAEEKKRSFILITQSEEAIPNRMEQTRSCLFPPFQNTGHSAEHLECSTVMECASVEELFSGKVIIGYWKCRGLVHSIRLILEYTQTPYIFLTEQSGPEPHCSKDLWFEKKEKALRGFDFPNLPYYFDGQNRLTHTRAILSFLGRRHELEPPAHRQLDADLVEEVTKDLYDYVTQLVYFPEHRNEGCTPTAEEMQAKREAFAVQAGPLLADLADKLSRSDEGQFLFGQKPSHVDFYLYEILDHIRRLAPKVLPRSNACKYLEEFMQAMEQLPAIASYLKSDRFKPYPLWRESAFLGHTEVHV